MKEEKREPQSPLILRYHRLMDSFTKSDDERDFYLDNLEGFIIYRDLSKIASDLAALEKVFHENPDRFFLIPKLTFYETKKLMEGFINEKVYDIDTKEKLTEIIQSRESKEHFLEFLYDHHHELEKWQVYYQERSRIRIIEWLRNNSFQFVFEEDLDLTVAMVEKLKHLHFEKKVPKEINLARQELVLKSKSYYSIEALNPRPKRGRPPKQMVKVEIQPKFSTEIYLTLNSVLRQFLYIPDITNASSITFSSKFDSEEELLATFKNQNRSKSNSKLEELSKRLATLHNLSEHLENKGISKDVQSGFGRSFKQDVEKKSSTYVSKTSEKKTKNLVSEENTSVKPKKKSMTRMRSRSKKTS